MARIFTTRFQFNHKNYDAIVTVLTINGQVQFNIRLFDDELYDLIPGGKIRYQGEDGFNSLKVENGLAQSLIRSIAVSIDDHMVRNS